MPALPVRPRPPVPGAWHLWPRRLMLSRGCVYWRNPNTDKLNLVATVRRRHTVFHRSNLRFLAVRRNLARQCRDLGFAHVGRGVWYDQAADVRYYGVVSCDDWGF